MALHQFLLTTNFKFAILDLFDYFVVDVARSEAEGLEEWRGHTVLFYYYIAMPTTGSASYHWQTKCEGIEHQVQLKNKALHNPLLMDQL
jgi:hypothetical protein